MLDDFAFVWALAAVGDTIYAGGSFANVGGAGRYNLAAIDAASGIATDWNVEATSTVYALAVDSHYIYVGGGFDYLGGEHHERAGAIDRQTGSVVGWNGGSWSGSFVLSLDVANENVYAGGFFSTADDQSREALAALEWADKIFHAEFEPAL
ncbi:MAG TPA: hypothetical protein VGH81_01015 [Rudaea sp.]